MQFSFLKDVIFPKLQKIPVDLDKIEPRTRYETTFYSTAGPSALHAAVTPRDKFSTAEALHSAAFESLVKEAAAVRVDLDPRVTVVAKAVAVLRLRDSDPRGVVSTFLREWDLYRRHLFQAHGIGEEKEWGGADVEALRPRGSGGGGEFHSPSWSGGAKLDPCLSLARTLDEILTLANLTSHVFWSKHVQLHFSRAGLELPHLGISAEFPSNKWGSWTDWADRHAAQQRASARSLTDTLLGGANADLTLAREEGEMAARAYFHHKTVAAFAAHAASVKSATVFSDPISLRTEAFRRIVARGWETFETALAQELRDMLFRADSFWQGKKRREGGRKWVDSQVDAWVASFGSGDMARRLRSLKPSHLNFPRGYRSELQSSTAQAARRALLEKVTGEDWAHGIMKSAQADFNNMDAETETAPFGYGMNPSRLGKMDGAASQSGFVNQEAYAQGRNNYMGDREAAIGKTFGSRDSVPKMDTAIFGKAVELEIWKISHEWAEKWKVSEKEVNELLEKSENEDWKRMVREKLKHATTKFSENAKPDSSSSPTQEDGLTSWWQGAAQICMHLISYKYLGKETRGRASAWSMSLFSNPTSSGSNIINTECVRGLTLLLSHFSHTDTTSALPTSGTLWATAWLKKVKGLQLECDNVMKELVEFKSPAKDAEFFLYKTQGSPRGKLWVGGRAVPESVLPSRKSSPALRGKYAVSKFQPLKGAVSNLIKLSNHLPAVTKFEDGELSDSYSAMLDKVDKLLRFRHLKLDSEYPAVFRALAEFARAGPREFGLAGMWIGYDKTGNTEPGRLHPILYWLACRSYVDGLASVICPESLNAN